MFSRHHIIGTAFGLAAMLAFGGQAIADSCITDDLAAEKERPDGFPERALTMIVPYGPGGGSSQYGQAHAQAFTELTDVAVNVEHKPGGSGAAGLTAYMAAPSDGYTVLEHIDDAASGHALDPSKPNPAKDLIPLVTAQITFNQIYIRTDEDRFTNWDEFVDFVKESDGEATIANVSKEGSMERVNLKFVTDHYDIELQQISFDKAGARYGALAGGQVDALLEQPGDVRQFIEADKFKPILTLLPERPSAFSDTPSLADKGMDFDPLMRFRGMYVHKDTPPERVEWLQWAFQKAFCEPSFQEFNKRKFMHLVNSFRDTEGSRELINSTVETYREVYKEMGLTEN